MSVTDKKQSVDLLTISDYKRSLLPCHITTATEGPKKTTLSQQYVTIAWFTGGFVG